MLDVTESSIGLPPPGTVRLRWRVPGPADQALLSPEETDRAARFHHAADRHAYVAAHTLKREMIAAATRLPAAALRWQVGPQGRPELHPAHGWPSLRFNLTHCRTLVACAMAREDDVGVDVEAESRQVAALALARRFFAPAEAVALAELPPERRQAAFLRLWTLKEAFVKATGEGVAFGLDRFVVRTDPPTLVAAPAVSGAVSSWRLLQIEPVPGHILAVALRRRRGNRQVGW